MYHTGNATADENGNLKVASPIVKLFSDGSSELNAEFDGVVTTRLSEGVYQITGCLGLNADRAWGGEDGGITNPKCRNGYERIWNDYEVQEDGSLIIRTYHRVHSDAMPFAQNRLNLEYRPYNEERDSEEWVDRSPIDIPLGAYLMVRVQMPAREEEQYVPATCAISHSNVYCTMISPAGRSVLQ
ncbi:phage tail fiber protein [Pectobacterium jejuense]